jgi:hypothetical protein
MVSIRSVKINIQLSQLQIDKSHQQPHQADEFYMLINACRLGKECGYTYVTKNGSIHAGL